MNDKLSYINENNEGWINGEDLKSEYVYFNKHRIIGEMILMGIGRT